MDLPVDRVLVHHTNAVLGRVAAYLHERFPEQMTAEVSREIMRIAREVPPPQASRNREPNRFLP